MVSPMNNAKSLLLFLCIAGCAGSPSRERAPARTPKSPAAATAPSQPRFDELVREDFFAYVLHGDRAALDRAMALCERTLRADPKHAEALAWHGAGLLGLAGARFGEGDRAAGQRLWKQGLGEMDRAVELEPDNVGTRIPRGAVLLATSPYVPQPYRDQLLDKALGDYEHALALQRGELDHLSGHARSMLLYGLADGWDRRGDADRARGYYRRLAESVPGTAYGKRARAWLAGERGGERLPCGGCHAR